MSGDIFIALGANLPHTLYGHPRHTLEMALNLLSKRHIRIKSVSRWYESAPIPNSNQPWYINAVALIETDLNPADLLAELHEVEKALGRERSLPNAARIIDLDLLAYGDVVVEKGDPPYLPHPRMVGRAFVLLPLRDLAPHWRHPKSGKTIDILIEEMPSGQQTRVL